MWGRKRSEPDSFARLRQALELAHQGRLEESVSELDTILRQAERKPDSVQDEHLAAALYNKGVALREMKRPDTALAVWRELSRLFRDHPHEGVQLQVIQAQLNQGNLEGRAGRREEALATYADAEAGARRLASVGALEVLGSAILNRAHLLGDLHQTEASIAEYERVLVALRDRSEPVLVALAANARGNKADCLGLLGRDEEALALYEESVRQLAYESETELIEARSIAWLNVGQATLRLGRSEDALAIYDALVAELRYRSDLVVRQQVAKALFNRGVVLASLGREADAVAADAELVSEVGASRDPLLFELVGRALHARMALLQKLGREDELERARDQMSSLDADLQRIDAQEAAPRPSIREGDALREAERLRNQSTVLAQQERLDEALDLWLEMERLLHARRDLASLRHLAWALDSKAVILIRLGHLAWAVEVLEDMVHRFKASADATLERYVGRARDHLETLRHSQALRRPTTASLEVNLALSTPLEQIQARAGRPHFVEARLHKDGRAVHMRYMAQDGAQLAEGLTGGSLVLSLMKRLRQEHGAHFAPDLVIDCGAALPREQPASVDSNYALLAEALVLGMSLEHAASCTGIGGIARFLDYEVRNVALTQGKQLLFMYAAAGKAQ